MVTCTNLHSAIIPPSLKQSHLRYTIPERIQSGPRVHVITESRVDTGLGLYEAGREF